MGLDTITTSAKIDIQHLSKQDVVVIWGGSKDVGKKMKQKRVLTVYKDLLRQTIVQILY
jgi:acetylglutamate kinase